MASNSLKYRGHDCKDAFGQAIGAVGINFQFSEGLLKSLYYETDVGSIPRGINFHNTASIPQYADLKNWKYPIHGCYWCVDKVKTADFLGICCSRECLIYFHDWCIERVEFFTNKRFCRLLGCDNILHNRDSLYCSGSDQGKFDAAFSQFADYQKLLKGVIRSGPSWYEEATSINMKYNRAKYNLEFPEQFRTELIYNTDVGVIPRGTITLEHPTSKYYDSSNWLAKIKGCYNCDNRNVAKFYNEMFCKERCQLVFYEWCRKKIERETTTRFCQLPGCPKLASQGFECCNREHSNQIEQKYTDAKIVDIKRLSSVCPTWYNRSVTPFESIPSMNLQPSTIKTQLFHSHLPMQRSTEFESEPELNTKIFQNKKSNTSENLQNKLPCEIKVSENPDKYILIEFRDYLIFQTDIGIIPRGNPSEQQLASPYSLSPNWKKEIHGCYCCGDKLSASTGNSCICSYSCYLIFYEWCRRKIKSFTGITLCKFPGCMKPVIADFDYCNNEHAQKIEDEYARVKKLKNIEKLVERDPDWYIPHHIRNSKKRPVTDISIEIDSQYKPKTETLPNQTPTPFLLKHSKPGAVDTSSVQFKTRWKDILKRRFGKQTKPYMIVPFSEILLNTLCYGTDIGYIPRRTDSEGLTVPIYENSNWEKDITGCYWCGDKSTDVQGICCGNDCIFYFHEWCVERAGMFQQRRFCKLPGCESVSYQSKYECCSVAHQEKYIHDLLSFHDGNKLKRQLFLGPSWYDNITRSSDSSHNLVQTSSSTIQPDFSKAKMRLAEELSTALLFYTDVGPIPRSYRLSGDSSSQYSTHANWNRKIEGCYLCKQRTSDNEYLCSGRCYMIFHEWCRLKVHEHIKENYCKQPGCKYKSRPDVSTCSDTHSELLRDICEKYNLALSEFNRLVSQGPYWYDNLERSNTSVTSNSSKTGVTFKASGARTSAPSKTETLKAPDVPKSVYSKTETPSEASGAPTAEYSSGIIPQFHSIKSSSSSTHYEGNQPMINCESIDGLATNEPPKCLIIRKVSSEPRTHSQTFSLPTSSISSDIKINVFKFSNKLSTNLSQYTDVGLVPRRSGQQNRTSDQFPPRNPCSNVDIVGCYWCGNSNTCFEEMTCCVRCWLLLHEWCVRRVEQVCRLKLCGLPGCEEPRVDSCECCSIEHVKERSLLIGGVSIRLQEEIELTLGPKWYRDLTPVYFSESGPLSELSNSFPSLLNLYHMIWPTVHHCMCAQKLLGTPYLHHVRKMERLHELEEWEVRCVKWVRPDWEGVRMRVLYQALMAKFQQNCVLKGLLLRTGSRPLVCRDNVHLGDVLMSVREVLRAAAFFPSINSSFGECESNSSSNSLTKVKLNEPFGVLQPSESKAYTPPDQTPTPSYLGNFKPKDVNAGIGSQFESNLVRPASTDVSHHGTSNDVIICSNMSPESDVLSHHTINSPSQINQPSPTNFTVENSSNPQPISPQWTHIDKLHKDAPTNKSDSFEGNIVPHADLASSDIPDDVQVTSGFTNERSQDPGGVAFSPPVNTDDMQ